MRNPLRPALIAGVILLPAAAFAQMPLEPVLVIPEPVIIDEPVIIQEPDVYVQQPMLGGELFEEDARAIAMMNGMVEVDEVDTRMFDGNFEVDGFDASGDDIEMTIDAETGAVLSVDN